MIVTVALLVLGVTAILQIYFQIRFLRHAPRVWQDGPGQGPARGRRLFATEPVSVVICAKNEAVDLERVLPIILGQNYRLYDDTPAFEVLVVNDASTDSTRTVLERFQQRFRNLRVLNIDPAEPRSMPGKKFALSRGLTLARREIVVCTDADCEPASELWLHHMVAPFLAGKDIVAGYGGYRRSPGWLNAFVRYETLHTFFLYYTFWKGGAPYMAVGRNLAARKSVFRKAAAHPQWSALPSGDDDLLIQFCATARNMAIVTHPESFTWSEAKETFGEYLTQKQRHVSTGKYYNRRSKRLLAAYSLLRLLRTLLPITMVAAWLATISLFMPGYITSVFDEVPLIGIGVILCFWIWLVFPGLTTANRLTRFSDELGQPTTGLGWIAFFFCWILYNAVLAPWILWKTKQRWK